MGFKRGFTIHFSLFGLKKGGGDDLWTYWEITVAAVNSDVALSGVEVLLLTAGLLPRKPEVTTGKQYPQVTSLGKHAHPHSFVGSPRSILLFTESLSAYLSKTCMPYAPCVFLQREHETLWDVVRTLWAMTPHTALPMDMYYCTQAIYRAYFEPQMDWTCCGVR